MSVILGPRQTNEERERRQLERTMGQALADHLSWSMPHTCNCIGPQPGETKCPCALAAELRQGADMIQNGVVIGGRKYRLVPA